MPRPDEIATLLAEIRSCHDCTKESSIDASKGILPLVFCGSDPQIMVVSEVPPKTKWLAGKGGAWQNGDLYQNDIGGIQRELCRWLGCEEKRFQEKVFWIQRMNCWIEHSNKKFMKTRQHCSNKFLNRCIIAVEPKMIIALGKPAAKYFTSVDRLEDIVGVREKPSLFNDGERKHSCRVAYLYHPSRQNKATGLHESTEHADAITELRKILSPILL